MVEAYPLHWPAAKPRNTRPERARFGDHSVSWATNQMLHEIRLLGGRNVVVSTNLLLRNDGLPRSGQRRVDDQAVAVYFELDKDQKCFAVDRWDRVEHNLWAIYKSIEALRGLSRWGAKDMVDAAFRGFQALPPPSSESLSHLDRSELKQLIKDHHPDTGDGNVDRYQEALQELRRK